MLNLVCTYRLQFHKNFTFDDLQKILPYLQKLGATTLYASPVFEAVSGSNHGYDVLNPCNINPQIGNISQLHHISSQLKEAEMYWLQDIVPNHMAFHSHNKWLMDVLEKGRMSEYAPFFDIDWTGQIMVPFLGSSLEEVIDNDELKLVFEDDKLKLKYWNNAYPVKPLSYATILQFGKTPNEAINNFINQIEDLQQTEDTKELTLRWNEVALQFTSLLKDESTSSFIKQCMEDINNRKELLRQLAGEQFYRLCHWKETDTQINYRRFFTVNGLICLNMQNEKVFNDYHKLIQELVADGVFNGLRVDHIDGLYNPTEYLNRLRELAQAGTHITVEKILQPGESLPAYWQVQGNTGYDFLALVNNLFTKNENGQLFTDFYEQISDETASLPQQIHNKKANILFNHMAGELENLFQLFKASNLVDKRKFASIRADELKEAIGEFLINCPVYRFYGNSFPLAYEEAAAVQNILNRVRNSNADLQNAVRLLEDALLRNPQQQDEERNKRTAHFYQRCMQFTGPLMAKGVEDTLMYTYNRFLAHNEVGDNPESFGISISEFHHAMKQRQTQWAYSLNTTSTHDTKRGEDVRARLNVLSEIADEWLQTVALWQQQNAALKQNNLPDANDEYFIYQSLIGAYPFSREEEEKFPERFQQYIEKALREAKIHSSWTSPNPTYENAAKEFAAGLLNRNTPFWQSFQQWMEKIVDPAIINSLTQMILKFTCPGVPDVYQGSELWDFSFVDPDNRRPVDYAVRQQFLNEIDEAEDKEQLLVSLWKDRRSGKIKLWLLHTLMQLRRQQPELFASGEYLPLKVEGAYKDNVLAFARKHKLNIYIVAVSVHTASICKEQACTLLEMDWKNTKIYLPEKTDSEWEHVFTNVKDEHRNCISAQHLFNQFPFAIIKGKQQVKERSAGILLHITSLPSPFGIGDLGKEAYQFADFLAHSNQKYWQLLPLNPIEVGQGYSPYSATSAMAGNTLLISPEMLMKDGLLKPADLNKYHLPADNRVNFSDAERVKAELFDKAYNNFSKMKKTLLHTEFKQFIEEEKYWLDDFAHFQQLKKQNGGKPWFQWDTHYRLRDKNTLDQLKKEKAEALQKIKWLQFIFSKQWKQLKKYGNDQNILFIGDMPIYVSYDSSDVWSNREIFEIDEQGNITGMAGTPPDTFSTDGQLWGMPVFKWEVMKERNYDWWIQRLKRNIELFDMVRIDHFRAFAAYWNVPANSATAKNGAWKPGPGSGFFKAVEEALGELPLIAEDLGDVDDTVFNLRDEFNLPGMKVLQFAFGSDMPTSVHIPHNHSNNFIVYTGTHDNNTARGWYKQADDTTRKMLEQYAARSVNEEDVFWIMARMCYASVAKIAILPMQDVLNLDETARMNIPASATDNWSWRLTPNQIDKAAEERLREWCWLYNR